MTIRDHLKQTKLRAKVITVDPRYRRIEVVPDGGGVIQVAIYEIGSNFTWPREGEIWSIYREGLNWVLGNPVPADINAPIRIEDLNPGEAIAPSVIYTAPNTTLARKYVQIIGNGQDLTYIVYHNLATKDVTASISTIKTVGANTVSYNVLDENSIKVVFSSAPPIDSYQISVGEVGPHAATHATGGSDPLTPAAIGGLITPGGYSSVTRVLGTSYRPSTTRPVLVIASPTINAPDDSRAFIYARCDNSNPPNQSIARVLLYTYSGTGQVANYLPITFIVPAGYYYSFTSTINRGTPSVGIDMVVEQVL
jgi:hypothetical protein